jgi:DNA-binding HxlR family transcriptional regulator
MRWQDIGDMECSVARTLSIVGDRWTLLIIRDAFLGVRRFEDFRSSLGTTRHRLSHRLRKLVAAGILRRVQYTKRPPRFEYRLTDRGRDLYPIVVSLTRWGDRWLAGDAGPPVALIHRDCGGAISPVLTCPDCGEPIHARNMEARRRPKRRSGGRAADIARREGRSTRSRTNGGLR